MPSERGGQTGTQDRANEEPAELSTNVASSSQSSTGIFGAVRHRSRIARWWSRLGLTVGQRMATVVRDDHVYLLLMAALVGTVSGAAAGLLLEWVEKANHLFPRPDQDDAYFALVVGVPVVGGLLVGALRWLASRFDASIPEGVPAVVEAVAHKRGVIPGKNAVLAGVGTGLTIGSGGSVGHEGPVVFIGASVGSVIARFFGLRLRRRIAMVGAGAAGGLAAAFNAPLAGVIFTVEVVFGRSAGGAVGTMSVFTPLIVAAVTGTFVSHSILGARPEFMVGELGHESVVEMVAYLILALGAGLLGPLMGRAILGMSSYFERSRIPVILRPAVGGLGLGILAALTYRELLFSGRETIHDALHSGVPWTFALQLLVLKILAVALTLGSGGVGGFFMPTLFVGACLGAFVHGAVAIPLFGEGATDAAAYALVGMGALLGANFRAPLTPIVMIFELTHDYDLILPLMAACILSSFIAGRVQSESIFQLFLRRRGVDDSPTIAEGEVMKRASVASLMRPGKMVFRADTLVCTFQAELIDGREPAAFLVDNEGGVVSEVKAYRVLECVYGEGGGERTAAAEIADPYDGPVLQPEDTLAGALWAFDSAKREVLPVVDARQQTIASLRRADVVSYYTTNVLQRQEEALQIRDELSPVREVGLGAGVILERVLVGEAWANKTLAQLDLRGKVQVQVIEWSRNEQLLPIDPHAPLKPSDVLALVGTRDGILRARRLR